MIKGTMRIELFDDLTGKIKDVREEHNMITGAAAKYANFAINHSYISGNQTRGGFAQLYDNHLNLFRGIVLLDDTVTENAGNIWLPAGVKPVAYGATGSYGDDYLMMGDYMSAYEEYVPGESIKRVWEWKSTHGNGTIACACLTNVDAGFYGFGAGQNELLPINTSVSLNSALSAGNIITQTEYGIVDFRTIDPTHGYFIKINDEVGDFAIDSDNDIKYQFKVLGTKLQIITHKMTPEYFDVFNGVHMVQPATVEEYNNTFSGGSNVYWFFNTDEQILYFWLSDSTGMLGKNSSVAIHKFDVVNKVLTPSWKTYTNDGDAPAYLNFAVTDTAVYTAHYAYYPDNSRDKIRKYTFSGASSQAISTYVFYSDISSKPYILNGIIYWNRVFFLNDNTSYPRRAIIDTSDDEVRYSPMDYQAVTGSDHATNVVPPFAKTQPIFGMCVGAGIYSTATQSAENDRAGEMTGNVYMPTNYLATINNLSEPVTKTGTYGMKVSYTLAKVQE